MRTLILVLLVLLAGPAGAFVSQETPAVLLDGTVVPSRGHQLYWRRLPSDPWIPVGLPQPLALVEHPNEPEPFLGVDWTAALTGTVEGIGEFYATAIAPQGESVPSNEIDLGLDPPPAPTMHATTAELRAAFLRRRALGDPRHTGRAGLD